MTLAVLVGALAVPLLMACSMAAPAGDGAGARPDAPFGLRLEARAGRCFAVSGTGADARAVDLELPTPCRFSTESDGRVRVVTNGDYGYAIVEAEESRQGRTCATLLKSIRLTKDGWAPSQVRDRVAACPGARWDADIFGGLFK